MWGIRDKDIPIFRVVCVSLRTRNQHCRLVQLFQFNCLSLYLTGKTNTFEGICLLYSCGCEWMLVCRQKGICCIWIGAELEREQFLYYVFSSCHGNIGVSKNTHPTHHHMRWLFQPHLPNKMEENCIIQVFWKTNKYISLFLKLINFLRNSKYSTI